MPFSQAPNEVLYLICENLNSAEDLCNFRLSCSAFAGVGLRYLVPRVSLLRIPKAIERLAAIANHPVLQNYVEEVIYFVDIVDVYADKETFKSRMRYRFPSKYRVPLNAQPPGIKTYLGLQVEQIVHPEESRKLSEELDGIYTTYEELKSTFLKYPYKDEASILGSSLVKLPRLKSLIIDWGVTNDPFPKATRWPLSEAVASGFSLLYDGTELDTFAPLQLKSFFAGVVNRGINLDSLTIQNIELSDLINGLILPKWDPKDSLFRSVRKFKLTVEERFTGNNTATDSRRINDILKLWPNLEYLCLPISMGASSPEWFAAFSLTFKGLLWNNLRHLSIDSLSCEPDIFLGFLQARSSTLRELIMGKMNLQNSTALDWVKLLERMSSMLSLTFAKFTGDLTGQIEFHPFAWMDIPPACLSPYDPIDGTKWNLNVGQVLGALLCSKVISETRILPETFCHDVFEDIGDQNWVRLSDVHMRVVVVRHYETLLAISEDMKG
ncbi:hypothetical protein MMC10_002610 [Thelotrema lepadinum]|nr:hypothetical protein [Thelotrema lepadinum]